jgi:hypothetical protein
MRAVDRAFCAMHGQPQRIPFDMNSAQRTELRHAASPCESPTHRGRRGARAFWRWRSAGGIPTRSGTRGRALPCWSGAAAAR